MSDDSAPDDVSEPQAASASPSSSVPDSFAGDGASKRGRLRQVILLCLLGLMLVALFYDYRVARPRVEKAFDQIVQLNDKMNLSAEAIPTLNTHIHKEIGRDPARTYTEGLYRVEVFSWTAGLPFRTHDLFAVYVPNGNDLVFMRHYKFSLPDNELDPPKPRPSTDTGDAGETPAGAGGMQPPPIEGPGGGRGRGGPGAGPGGSDPPGDPGGEGEGRPQRPRSDDDEPGTEKGASDSPDAASDTPPADALPDSEPTSPESTTPEPTSPEPTTPEPTTPEPTTPESTTPESTTPESSTPPAEKPVDAQPPADSDAAPAASEAKKDSDS